MSANKLGQYFLSRVVQEASQMLRAKLLVSFARLESMGTPQEPTPLSGCVSEGLFVWGAREGGRTLRKDVFLPSKHLLSAFYETLPFKNPSKNLVFTENPYWRLLRTLLRSTYC